MILLSPRGNVVSAIYSTKEDIKHLFALLVESDTYRTVAGPKGLPSVESAEGFNNTASSWWKGADPLITVFVCRRGWKIVMDLEASYASTDAGQSADEGDVPPAFDANAIADKALAGEEDT